MSELDDLACIGCRALRRAAVREEAALDVVEVAMRSVRIYVDRD